MTVYTLADVVSRTRSILYGAGLGEKPPIRQAAADALETTTGQTTVFAMLAGEGAKVKNSDVLSVYDPSTEDDAHVVYVLSTATDTITGVNSYLGSPTITAGDLDSALFEQNAAWTGYEIFQAIETVVDSLLWPYIYKLTSATIASPDLVDGQEAVAAGTEVITHAWQIIGSTNHPVAVSPRQPLEVSTSLASTGLMATFDWIDGSTGYYEYREKVDVTAHARLIALGAAGLLLGGSLAEATLERTKKDNTEAVAGRGQAANAVWRDFLTLRQNISDELSKRLPQRIYIDRG